MIMIIVMIVVVVLLVRNFTRSGNLRTYELKRYVVVVPYYYWILCWDDGTMYDDSDVVFIISAERRKYLSCATE